MGTVSIEIPGPGTYQVQCDPKLPALADGGTSGDVLAGKQFYNDQNAPVTGTMPNNPPQAVELSGGNSYTIPRGFHDGTGKVTGVGTVLPDLPSPAGAGDILAGKQAVSGDGTRLTGIMPNNPPEDVEVSGGEAQKIAIARALYKDAPFIVLDEPTAALDPIAEAEIYRKFNDIIEDRTAIYISHRLSSCKFCDEILVFDRGGIVQKGTHEELVSDTAGKYHELWHAQAQYYDEDNTAG